MVQIDDWYSPYFESYLKLSLNNLNGIKFDGNSFSLLQILIGINISTDILYQQRQGIMGNSPKQTGGESI